MSSGRQQTVSLKAAPAKETIKSAGGTKGSWGKTPAKATGLRADGIKTLLSDGTSGIEIPVKTKMFEADRI